MKLNDVGLPKVYAYRHKSWRGPCPLDMVARCLHLCDQAEYPVTETPKGEKGQAMYRQDGEGKRVGTGLYCDNTS